MAISFEPFYFLFLLTNVLLQSVSAQVRVLQPPALAREFSQGYIKGSTAAFGTPYWGEQLIGKLVYGESKGSAHCNATDYELPPEVDAEEAGGFPRIVVVRRGVCHFVTKVRVAQDSKNAAAVIIVDEVNSTRKGADIRGVIMADDGWGQQVRIPSILISDEDGSKLIETAVTGRDVIVEMVWDVPNESVVHIDNWMSPAIATSVNFLSQFAPYAKILGHKVNFMPHYWIFTLPANYNSMCVEPELALELFCGMVPDWGPSNVTGKDVVEESVRQSCLWHATKTVNESLEDSGEYSAEWWNYVELVNGRCLRPEPMPEGSPLTADCSYGLMKQLGVPVRLVEDCVQEMGESYLIADLYNHAWSSTAMMINDARFSGPLDPFIVTRAICTGFASEPEVCTRLRSRHIHDYVFDPDRALDVGWIFGNSFTSSKGGVAWWVYLLSVASCIALCGIGICVYRSWLVKGLRNQLRYEVFEEVKTQISGIRPRDVPPLQSEMAPVHQQRFYPHQEHNIDAQI